MPFEIQTRLSMGAAQRRRRAARYALGLVLGLAAPVFAAEAPGGSAVAAQPGLVAVPVTQLDARNFLQLLVARSLDVQYSRAGASIAQHNEEAEAGLYEVTAFTSVRKEVRNRQRTLDELQLAQSSTPLLDETGHTEEFGLRNRIETGGEVSLSAKSVSKTNNLIPQTSFGVYDTERNGLITLTLKQPLLRNAGRTVTETDLRVAELERKAALEQLTQQTLKSSIDGLSLYWQLHRAQETVSLRKDALASSEALLTDTRSRVDAGRVPASALLEVQGAILNRKAEYARGQQALREAQSKLLTAMNVVWGEPAQASTAPVWHEGQTQPAFGSVSLEQMLSRWPPYQIALIRQEQAKIRLEYARNQMKPSLDFVLSYSATGMDYRLKKAAVDTIRGHYPDWFIGLNYEFPLSGNRKAQQQFLAQADRLLQADLEIEAINNAFANDLAVREGELANAQSVLKLSRGEVELRERIFANEQQRIQMGSGSISNLIQRQSDLIDAKQRLLENVIRYEVAVAMWQYARGTLLSDNGIAITASAQ